MSTLATDLQEVLGRSGADHGIPGAVVGVLADGRIETAAIGVLNLETGAPTTPDSVFQIGSVTKLYTATLVAQLAEQGRLNLDAPVREVLADFRVADPEVTAGVTPRHLLTHTSGIAGDDFTDTGRGDDCLGRYLDGIAQLGQDVPLGTVMSYSNTGFVILGRIVEVLTLRTFDEALRELLLAPLGLDASVTLPEDALRFRTAWGHVDDAGGSPRPSPVWSLATRSMGPAGGVCASAADVLRFACAHLDDGVAADGTRVLAPETARAMREPQVAVPDPWSGGSHQGLGWILDDFAGRTAWGHDGTTGGQSSKLLVVPDAGVAIVALANGGDLDGLWDDLGREILAATFGIATRTRPGPATEPLRESAAVRLTGRYERHGVRIDVGPAEGEVRATATVIEPLASQLGEPQPPQTMVVRASDAGRDVFVAQAPDEPRWLPMILVELGGERYLHMGARAQRACGERPPAMAG